MELNEMSFPDAQPIEGYGPGFIRIGGQRRDGPQIVTATGARNWGGLDDAASLVALADAVDVILMGMGEEIAPVPRALREALEEAGLGVEPMRTPSACRTYNVLVSEGRRVAAALLPV